MTKRSRFREKVGANKYAPLSKDLEFRLHRCSLMNYNASKFFFTLFHDCELILEYLYCQSFPITDFVNVGVL